MGYQSNLSVSRRVALSMAATAPVLPALAAVPPSSDRAAWDRAYHEYRRLKLRMEAYYALGPMHWLNEEYEFARREELRDPEAYEAAHDALRSEEEKQLSYYQPASFAARVLVKTPAPDLDAVAAKMQAHKDMIEGCIDYEKQTWTFIESDLRRLAI